jgi:hypothetical protein
MTRSSQSNKKPQRLSEVISDHSTSLGSLLKRASLLMQLEHLLADHLDPELADQFQLATIRAGRMVLITPAAAWATRLRMQVPELIGALQQAGYPDIERIDVRVAPLVEQDAEKRTKRELSQAARQALEAMSRIGTDSEEK